MKTTKKIIISGGGTGGHIFPALAIAGELKHRYPDSEILFVGAEDRMEMERVPAAGYRIIGLPVKGFKRRFTPANILVVIYLVKSILKAKKIISEFNPNLVVGVGGYASGPILRVAGRRGIPTLLQEQNSYAGVTNRLLAKKADKICVAYEGMQKYFPAEKIVLTGNPVRKDMLDIASKYPEGKAFFKIPEGFSVILILGGSLGAATINKSILSSLDLISESKGIYFIWQSGRIYYDTATNALKAYSAKNIILFDFIHRMDLAYSVADIIVSRSGAITLSELAIVGKPAILVPSPNVAEDHQTKNALALAEKNAAIMIPDTRAGHELMPAAVELMRDSKRLKMLAENISRLAVTDSTEKIINEIDILLNTKSGS